MTIQKGHRVRVVKRLCSRRSNFRVKSKRFESEKSVHDLNELENARF